MVAEINVRQSLDYLRNWPANFTCAIPISCGGDDSTHAIGDEWLFGPRRRARFPGLQGARSSAAITLAFDKPYR